MALQKKSRRGDLPPDVSGANPARSSGPKVMAMTWAWSTQRLTPIMPPFRRRALLT
jgi:hypothetical protein